MNDSIYILPCKKGAFEGILTRTDGLIYRFNEYGLSPQRLSMHDDFFSDIEVPFKTEQDYINFCELADVGDINILDIQQTTNSFFQEVLYPNIRTFMGELNEKNKGELTVGLGNDYDNRIHQRIKLKGKQNISFDPKKYYDYMFFGSLGKHYYRCSVRKTNKGNELINKVTKREWKENPLIGNLMFGVPAFELSLGRFTSSWGNEGSEGFRDKTGKLSKSISNSPLKDHFVSFRELMKFYTGVLK